MAMGVAGVAVDEGEFVGDRVLVAVGDGVGEAPRTGRGVPASGEAALVGVGVMLGMAVDVSSRFAGTSSRWYSTRTLPSPSWL